MTLHGGIAVKSQPINVINGPLAHSISILNISVIMNSSEAPLPLQKLILISFNEREGMVEEKINTLVSGSQLAELLVHKR